ncbi:hypothetical protein R5R73_05875 [Salinicola sp. LHM]|uniref:hypothetical protein n=1 Tax=Salinicola sp. LHM TaxID=3065298 RepID=UPI002ACF0494|nr:hypothetical protein [Salinicola sp. LHM]WQH34215.1 hypothetical protein R5R73_05875 [Salinicola sp. LHM]
MQLSFNQEYYLRNNPDVAQAVQSGAIPSAEYHWLNYGAAEGRNPNAVFDTQAYLSANPDVAEATEQGVITPLEHFLEYGAAEGRAPSDDYQIIADEFNEQAYLKANADVASGVENGALQSGYEHWVLYGQYEERPGATLEDGTPVSEVIGESAGDGENSGDDRILDASAQTDGDGNLMTSYTADDLSAYQGIRFSGSEFAGETINLEGLGDKRLLVDNASLALNLNQMSSGQIELDGADVIVYGENDGQGNPTGSLTSLDVNTASASNLELGGSAAAGLTDLVMTGTGDLTLTGATIGTMAQGGSVSVDASGLAGSLVVGDDGVLSNATSITAGGGADSLAIDDISGIDAAAPVINGGAGDDTLTVTGSMTMPEPGDTVTTDVSGFETVNFDSYVEVAADSFDGVENFTVASGASLSHLGADQVVTATAGGTSEADSPLILRDAGGDVNVVADFTADENADALDLLALTAQGSSLEGDTLTLSGSGKIAYSDSGRAFHEIDASDLTGGLIYAGADYVKESVSLGSGKDALDIADGSIHGNMDSITGFDAAKDTLDIGPLNELNSINVGAASSIDEAFDMAATESAATANGYVAFEMNGNSYVYADTETQSVDDKGNVIDPQGEVGVSYNDFAVELTGVQGEITETNALA